MNSLISLWTQLAVELAGWCCTCADRDIKTVAARVEHEGTSFLTITLPSFCKDFERGLDEGQVSHAMFASFSKHRELPRFLGGFLERVFDRTSGRLLDEPCIDSIFAVRQLTLVYGKIFLVASETRVRKAMQDFVECENDVVEHTWPNRPELVERYQAISELLFKDVYQEVDWKVFDLDVRGKHGPGATADKLSGNGKFDVSNWTRRLEGILPFGELLLVNRGDRDIGDTIDVVEPGAEMPVRVIPVPKTQRAPRIIAIEPTCMQFAQQAISEVIVKAIKRNVLLDRLIGFDDQVPNQEMARKGSLDDSLATLDLSEASDRVSLKHVEMLTDGYPCLQKAVIACRSERADVPGHGVIPLAKYASMGSALTFPIEAMVFLTVVFVGIENALSRPLTHKDISSLSSCVRVYGDDILVPTDYVRSVIDALTSFGMVVNSSKSFWTGKFRESCGKEYYAGNDVCVTKLRREFPTSRRHATEIIGLVAFRNLLYKRGLWKTCSWLDARIREMLSHFPVVLDTSPVVGRHSFLGYETQRMCERLHRPLVKGYVVDAPIPLSAVSGNGALFKCLHRDRREPFPDKEHLNRAGRPRSVNIRTRWAVPY